MRQDYLSASVTTPDAAARKAAIAMGGTQPRAPGLRDAIQHGGGGRAGIGDVAVRDAGSGTGRPRTGSQGRGRKSRDESKVVHMGETVRPGGEPGGRESAPRAPRAPQGRGFADRKCACCLAGLGRWLAVGGVLRWKFTDSL